MTNRQCAIEIQYAQVPAALTNYVLSLNRSCFPTSANEIFDPSSANASQADGGDIRFYSDSSLTTQLPCDVTAWAYDSTSGAADALIEVHIRIPTVSNTANTTLYVDTGLVVAVVALIAWLLASKHMLLAFVILVLGAGVWIWWERRKP